MVLWWFLFVGHQEEFQTQEVLESPSLEWMWHSLMWVGGAHSLDSMLSELFSSLNGSGVLLSITTFLQTVFIFQLHAKQPQEQVENMISV